MTTREESTVLPGGGRSRTLGSLEAGEEATVRAFHLPRALARRLLELGLLPGTRVRLVRRAPLGDPLELRLRNYALSIGREEAAQIEVETAG